MWLSKGRTALLFYVASPSILKFIDVHRQHYTDAEAEPEIYEMFFANWSMLNFLIYGITTFLEARHLIFTAGVAKCWMKSCYCIWRFRVIAYSFQIPSWFCFWEEYALIKMNKVVLFGPETHYGTLTLYMLVFSLPFSVISAARAWYLSACPALSQFYKWEFSHLIHVGKCHTKLLFSIKDRRMEFVYVWYI